MSSKNQMSSSSKAPEVRPKSVSSVRAVPGSSSNSPPQTRSPALTLSNTREGGSGNRRRGGRANNSVQNSSGRSNASQKSRNRRPRRAELDDDDILREGLTMRSPMTRKGQTSITHLLDLALPPPDLDEPRYTRGSRSNINSRSRTYYFVDKERYVHGNYRFIVDPRRSYNAQAGHADVYLEWTSILQVLASAHYQGATCPICLCVPITPRMAKCGHIFCLPCLIRYMYSTDDEIPVPERKVRKQPCPICESIIVLGEARCVGWYGSSEETVLPTEGGKIVLRLMERLSGNTLVYPRNTEARLPKNDIPWYQAGDVADYARIMKGSEEYISNHYDSELQALQQQEREDELMFGDDTRWVRKAMSSVREARKSLEGIGNPVSKSSVPSNPTPGLALPQHASAQEVPSSRLTDENELSSQVSELHIDSQSPNQVPPTISNARSIHNRKRQDLQSSPRTVDRTFYFYQALPHFYLSPLDIRILNAAFGSYEHFPDTIIPEIERISTGHTVDEELRRRIKVLSHLPLGCEVSFLECDLTDVVSSSVLESFKDEILQRRRHNHEKAAREEQARIRAEKNESRGWASGRKEYADDFSHIVSPPSPRFTDQDFAPLVPPTHSEDDQTLADPPHPVQTSRTVWGTTTNTWASEERGLSHPPEPDGWLDDWEMEQQFSGVSGTDNNTTPNQGGSSSGGKKKKGKKITLMSTTARRGA